MCRSYADHFRAGFGLPYGKKARVVGEVSILFHHHAQRTSRSRLSIARSALTCLWPGASPLRICDRICIQRIADDARR